MPERTVDWDAATPEQIDGSWRAWKVRLWLGAVSWTLVAAVAFARGGMVLGVVAAGVGGMWVLGASRWAVVKHRQLRADAARRTGGT